MFFVPIGNSRWPPSADIVLTWDPMGKCLKNFSSETSKPVQSKHCMNVHWMDLYKSYVFFWKFKMAAISGHSFNMGPYGKMFKKFETSGPIGNSRWPPSADIV